jgi:transposase
VKKRGIGESCTAINFASVLTDKQPMPMQSNKLDFSNQNVYVGFDVHLKNWRVSIMVNDIHHKTFSQNPSPEQLVRYLSDNFPGGNYISAYEAGFCGFWIHQHLEKLGVKSMVINPADIPTTGKETVQKEDKRDSLKIVKSLRGGLLQPIYTPCQESLEDRGLLRVRVGVAKDLARAKNRVKSYLHFMGIDIPREYEKQSRSWTRAWVNWLKDLPISERSKQTIGILIKEGNELNETKKLITRHLTTLVESPKYAKNYQLLRSVPGIGLINAITFLLELEDINRFKTIDHLCSFIGLVPSTRSSGEREKTGNITPRGNNILRKTLMEGAWVAIRRDPALMKKFIDLRKRMKDNQAIVRIAKKLAGRIYFVLTKQKPYQLGCVK